MTEINNACLRIDNYRNVSRCYLKELIAIEMVVGVSCNIIVIFIFRNRTESNIATKEMIATAESAGVIFSIIVIFIFRHARVSS